MRVVTDTHTDTRCQNYYTLHVRDVGCNYVHVGVEPTVSSLMICNGFLQIGSICCPNIMPVLQLCTTLGSKDIEMFAYHYSKQTVILVW